MCKVVGCVSFQSSMYMGKKKREEKKTHIKGRDVFGAHDQSSRVAVVLIFRYVLDHMAVLHLKSKHAHLSSQ